MRKQRAMAAVLALCLVVTGCGDDDDSTTMSLEDYYSALLDDLAELREVSDEAFTTLDESSDLEALQRAFADLPESLEAFVDAIGGYEPPSEVRGAHDAAASSADAYLAELQRVNEDVQATTTVDEFIATAGNDELEALVQAFNAQCAPLQTIAEEHEVDVDLDCPA